MQKTLKRLAMIKAAIALEDNEIIELQVAQLQGQDLPASVTAILQALADLDYATAVQLIEQTVADHTQLAVYEDTEVAALKLELQGLEQQLAQLNSQRDEYQHLIGSFNRQYSEKLGEKINEILRLRMMLSYLLLDKLDKSNPEDAEKQAEYEQQYNESHQDYQQFKEELEEEQQKPKAQTLDKEQQKRLKQAFRRASKLCHPDMVAEELKAQATEQFQILRDAYEQNDLEKVEEILTTLQNGGFATASEKVNDKEQLRAHIKNLRQRIRELQSEINEIENDDTYQLINELDGNYQDFFKAKSEELAEEQKQLRKELNHLMQEEESQ